jgi:hypothetical protein
VSVDYKNGGRKLAVAASFGDIDRYRVVGTAVSVDESQTTSIRNSGSLY